MGACCDKDAQNSSINQDLKKDRDKDKYVKKLLFLGSGGSGKSTLFKQLRTLHGEGFNPEDRLTYVEHIHAQIIEQMKLAIDNIQLLGEEEAEDDRKEPHRGLLELSENGRKAAEVVITAKETKLTAQVVEAVKVLWEEPQVKEMYEQRATTKLDDSTSYFWDRVDDFIKKDYIPSEEDILFVRYRTTGVVEQSFKIEKTTFNIFDVGGQKSERKKWMHCFDGVTAVIFVVSLSCYNEMMFEVDDMNSMDDTLELFAKTCNSQEFVNTPMILFLNKKDLFEEKIKNIPITVCNSLSDFEGDTTDFLETTDFIKAKFTDKSETGKTIFIHLTCATDRNNVMKVFNDVQQIVVERAMIGAGLMGDMGHGI